jgi:predicted transcriptional regulator
MDADDLYNYLSPLWAMLLWSNRHYRIDQIINANGLDNLNNALADIIWGKEDIALRWDRFIKNIKYFGPAMLSEILCKTRPQEYILWNSKVKTGLNYLQVDKVPKFDYQMNGTRYKQICEVCKEIRDIIKNEFNQPADLLLVDYFIWDELQIEVTEKPPFKGGTDNPPYPVDNKKIHNEIRDKIRDIGEWLGFNAYIEKRIVAGSQLDTIWEQKVGNMGLIIYVFEVQTKGNLDSLVVNLQQALSSNAVQGVVAVSDAEQIEAIKKKVNTLPVIREKLRYWDYKDVLEVHEKLEYVISSIINLDLVPKGF